ncbi:MAG TPA: hypothetical protein VNN20_11570 [Thermodesulfobacteriota bacterium]|nr:hypothetical protein [Thermodesulfobacteriota bacterium]
MATVTIQIPDPIFEIIKQRAEDTKSTPEAIIATNVVLVFSAARYDRSKWLKNQPNPDDHTAPWT